MSELTCFKAYDIRGEIGVNIDEGIAYRIGRAVAQHFGAKSIVIGFDARENGSAEMFIGSDALALAPFTEDVSYLEDGDWAVLKHDRVIVRDARGLEVTREIQRVPA